MYRINSKNSKLYCTDYWIVLHRLWVILHGVTVFGVLHSKCCVFVRVQSGDGSRKETVSQSVCPCFDASVAPPRRKQLKQLRTGVWTVLNDVLSSAEAPGGVDVRQGGERAANNPLRCSDYPLKPLPVCGSAAPIPGGNTVRQQSCAFNVTESPSVFLYCVWLDCMSLMYWGENKMQIENEFWLSC